MSHLFKLFIGLVILSENPERIKIRLKVLNQGIPYLKYNSKFSISLANQDWNTHEAHKCNVTFASDNGSSLGLGMMS